MRQPKWDKYEAALLIEAYWKIKNDGALRGAVISALSSTLRNRASFEIDDTFRNENGINMRLGELEYLFSEGKAGLKNTSDLFREMVDMYRNDKTNFEQILSEAKVQPYNKSSVREQFCEWVKETSPKLRPDIVCQLLEIGEEFCKKLKVLALPLFETTDVDTVKKYVRTVTNNKIFRIRNKKQYPAIVSAANMYYSFVRALPELEKASITQEVIEETAASNTAVQGDNGQTVDSVVPMQVPSGSLESNFSKWLLEVEKMAIPTCRSYVSALHSAESFAAENQLGTGSICTFNYDEALATISSLMQDARFKQYIKAHPNMEVIVTADHGMSRMAAKGFHLTQGVTPPPKSDVFNHGRYCELPSETTPITVSNTKKDGKIIAFCTHNHFTVSGYAPGEVHGGGSPEELLVPVLHFARVNKHSTVSRFIDYKLASSEVFLGSDGNAVLTVKTDEPASSLVVDFKGKIISGTSLDQKTWVIKIPGLLAGNSYIIHIYPNSLLTQREETIIVKRKGLIVDDDL